MRILSVDWGEARIGLALSDPTGTLASPLTTLHEKDKRAQIERVVEVESTLRPREELLEVVRMLMGSPALVLVTAPGNLRVRAERHVDFLLQRLDVLLQLVQLVCISSRPAGRLLCRQLGHHELHKWSCDKVLQF